MQRVLDATAVSLSGLCIVHCLALPVAAAALPMLGAFAEAEWIHWLFVAIAAPVAIMAIAPVSTQRPIPWMLPLMAAGGIGFLALGAAEVPDAEWGRGLTVAGGLMLAIGHILNWRRTTHRAQCALCGSPDAERMGNR